MSAEEAGTLPSVDHLLQVAYGYAQRAAEQAELIGAVRAGASEYPEPRSLADPAHSRLDAAARLSAFTRVADTFSVLAQTVALADAGDLVVRADTGWAQHVAGAVGVVSGDVYGSSRARKEWRCDRCGSGRRVSVSLNGGATFQAQCVPCGHVQPPPGREPAAECESERIEASREPADLHDPECESEYIAGAGNSPCQCERRATRARIARLAPSACSACRERDRGAVAVAGHGTCACRLQCGAVSCAGKTPPAGSALEHYLARGEWPDGTKGRLRVIADPGTGS